MRRLAASNLDDDRKAELITVCENMVKWFGTRTIGELDGALQGRYAAERMTFITKKLTDGQRVRIKTDKPAPIAAYRDLKILAAAINRFLKQKLGGIQSRFSPVLPAGPVARVRFLEREEMARLIWAAWRKRKKGSQWRVGPVYVSPHRPDFFWWASIPEVARQGDICGAALMPTIGRGYINVETGIFRRKPDEKEATSKQQPTVPLHPKLMAHIRRWQRLGIAQAAVVEFNGKPVCEIKHGFASVVRAAGLETAGVNKVTPHTLRHTSITWLLRSRVDIEAVSLYCGVSVDVIRKHYRHEMDGQHDPVLAAMRGFGRVKQG